MMHGLSNALSERVFVIAMCAHSRVAVANLFVCHSLWHTCFVCAYLTPGVMCSVVTKSSVLAGFLSTHRQQEHARMERHGCLRVWAFRPFCAGAAYVGDL